MLLDWGPFGAYEQLLTLRDRAQKGVRNRSGAGDVTDSMACIVLLCHSVISKVPESYSTGNIQNSARAAKALNIYKWGL